MNNKQFNGSEYLSHPNYLSPIIIIISLIIIISHQDMTMISMIWYIQRYVWLSHTYLPYLIISYHITFFQLHLVSNNWTSYLMPLGILCHLDITSTHSIHNNICSSKMFLYPESLITAHLIRTEYLTSVSASISMPMLSIGITNTDRPLLLLISVTHSSLLNSSTT